VYSTVTVLAAAHVHFSMSLLLHSVFQTTPVSVEQVSLLLLAID
jgi:hypothetical protein